MEIGSVSSPSVSSSSVSQAKPQAVSSETAVNASAAEIPQSSPPPGVGGLVDEVA